MIRQPVSHFNWLIAFSWQKITVYQNLSIIILFYLYYYTTTAACKCLKLSVTLIHQPWYTRLILNTCKCQPPFWQDLLGRCWPTAHFSTGLFFLLQQVSIKSCNQIENTYLLHSTCGFLFISGAVLHLNLDNILARNPKYKSQCTHCIHVYGSVGDLSSLVQVFCN